MNNYHTMHMNQSLQTSYFLADIAEIDTLTPKEIQDIMNAPIANAFQALVFRLEAQIARTETRLAELRAQLEASRKLAQGDPKGK